MNNNIKNSHKEEMNMLEILNHLWQEKILIFSITFIITLIGVGVSLLLTPVYESKVELLPPSKSSILELSLGNIRSKQEQTSEHVIKDFIQYLKSNELLRNFLDQEGVMSSLFDQNTTKEKAISKLDKMIKVVSPGKRAYKPQYYLKFQSKDADGAPRFANLLLQLAIDQYRKDAYLTFYSWRETEVLSLENKKNSLIATYEKRLDEEIAKLKEAYNIAQRLNIVEPLLTSHTTPRLNGTSLISDELRYLYFQGSKALKAELDVVRERKKNPIFIQGMVDIEQNLILLKSLNFNDKNLTPVKIDRFATAPANKIKPHRLFIVAISGVIGAFLAVMLVLIRNRIHNHQA